MKKLVLDNYIKIVPLFGGANASPNKSKTI